MSLENTLDQLILVLRLHLDALLSFEVQDEILTAYNERLSDAFQVLQKVLLSDLALVLVVEQEYLLGRDHQFTLLVHDREERCAQKYPAGK